MRNSTNIAITSAEASPGIEETTWSLAGAFIGFLSWLLALGIPFLVYGPNTLFFFLYTWPFFLALLPVAVVVGIALHSLLRGRVVYSCAATVLAVALMFGILFLWLMG
ncbi:Inner membrane protein YgbE [compost metagenome]